MEIQKFINLLLCPHCHRGNLELSKKSLLCSNCHHKYPLIRGIPVLIDKSSLDQQEKTQTTWFDHHYSHFPTIYKPEKWRQSMIKRIFNHTYLNKIHNYLDIGCGATAYTVIEAARQYNLTSFGLDISLEAMLKAQKISEKLNLSDKTAYIVASAQNLPFKNNSFDYVSAVSVLEHLDDDHTTVQKISQILKPKSHIFLCVPNNYLSFWFFLWPFYYYNDIRIGHKRHYSLSELTKLFGKYGLTLKENFYNGHLIKFVQLFLEKINHISDKQWWSIEDKDINSNLTGVQLNAIFQKHD